MSDRTREVLREVFFFFLIYKTKKITKGDYKGKKTKKNILEVKVLVMSLTQCTVPWPEGG